MASSSTPFDLPYRLDVLTPTVVDAVRSVGGLLFDLAQAGWNVRVLARDQDENLPLRILGVRPLNLDWTLDAMQERPRPRGLVVAAELYETDECVGVAVRDALTHAPTELTFWGNGSLAGLEHRLRVVRYEPSVAARAFKSHALAGASGDETEACRTVRRRPARSGQVPSLWDDSAGDLDDDAARCELPTAANYGRDLADATSVRPTPPNRFIVQPH